MAETFKRICLKDFYHPDVEGLLLKRGEEYITTPVRDGEVRVFTKYWFWIDESYFGGAEQFTGKDELKEILSKK